MLPPITPEPYLYIGNFVNQKQNVIVEAIIRIINIFSSFNFDFKNFFFDEINA
jgi:hypothetical protein